MPFLSPIPRSKPAFRVMPDGREVCAKTHAGRAEYRNRTIRMAKRQGGLCGLCGLPMTEPTFDHEFGRGMGGARRDDRIEINGMWINAAVHWKCNGEKGSRAVPYVIQQPTDNSPPPGEEKG